MKVFLSVLTALLITSVTPVFDAMAATPRKNGTATTTARSKSNTPTAAFTDAEKKLKDLENALKAKLAEIKKAEAEEEEEEEEKEDVNVGCWTQIDKNATAGEVINGTCKITECIDTHEVIDGVCKEKEPDSANKENNQPDEHAECWKEVDFATAGTWSGGYCDISKCEDGYKVDRSRTACEEDEQPDETNCWDNVEHAINGIDHGTHCEITECNKGYYIYNNKCEKEIKISGCHYDFDEKKYGVGYEWIQESEKDTESDGKQYCKITKCHPCTTLKENKCVLTNKCMLVEDTDVACWDLGGEPENANYEEKHWCYCSDGYKRDYFQFTTQRCVNNELTDM